MYVSSFFHATDSMNYQMNVSRFFHVDWQIDSDFFNRPITAHTQILVHRWGPITRILVLFRRWTSKSKPKPELSLPVVQATIQGIKQCPGRCQSCCPVEHVFARTPPVFGQWNATVAITFPIVKPDCTVNLFFFFNKKPTESLVCLATKLRIKSFTIFLHCRSSLAYMEWLCKPFVYITCDVLLQSFWQSPHCAFSLQVKHAKYNESRRFQSISLLIWRKKLTKINKKHLTYRLKIHIKLILSN